MTARFGRNKRRAAREAIETAQRELEAYQRRASSAEARVAEAGEMAVRRVLNQPETITEAMRIISRELGRSLPEELLPHAEKLLQSDYRRTPAVSFSAYADPMDTFQTITIQGHIDLRFAMKVPQY